MTTYGDCRVAQWPKGIFQSGNGKDKLEPWRAEREEKSSVYGPTTDLFVHWRLWEKSEASRGVADSMDRITFELRHRQSFGIE